MADRKGRHYRVMHKFLQLLASRAHPAHKPIHKVGEN
jgi:hypothetical protein